MSALVSTLETREDFSRRCDLTTSGSDRRAVQNPKEIVQKTAQIIDGIRSLDIYALSWAEHNLKEHSKARFRSDYGSKVDYEVR